MRKEKRGGKKGEGDRHRQTETKRQRNRQGGCSKRKWIRTGEMGEREQDRG